MKAAGFHELVRQLKEMQRRAREINGTDRLAYSELFSDEFMKGHTDFKGFPQMVGESPFGIKSKEDLEAVSDDEWEKYVASHTQFASWDAMREAAAGDWISRQMGWRPSCAPGLLPGSWADEGRGPSVVAHLRLETAALRTPVLLASGLLHQLLDDRRQRYCQMLWIGE